MNIGRRSGSSRGSPDIHHGRYIAPRKKLLQRMALGLLRKRELEEELPRMTGLGLPRKRALEEELPRMMALVELPQTPQVSRMGWDCDAQPSHNLGI